jgi:hypothetical protein
MLTCKFRYKPKYAGIGLDMPRTVHEQSKNSPKTVLEQSYNSYIFKQSDTAEVAYMI